MIKSKLDARERALELAVKTFETSNSFSSNLFMDWVKMFEQYLVSDAELPEVFDDNGHLKELFEVAQREMEKINKRNDDNYDLMKSMHQESAVTCKSEAE